MLLTIIGPEATRHVSAGVFQGVTVEPNGQVVAEFGGGDLCRDWDKSIVQVRGWVGGWVCPHDDTELVSGVWVNIVRKPLL